MKRIAGGLATALAVVFFPTLTLAADSQNEWERTRAAAEKEGEVAPPNRWFHQHFNVGPTPARYLAIHPPRGFNGISEKVEDRARDQIEYTDEDPSVRARFQDELAKRDLTSLMPEAAYRNRDYEWSYASK